VVARLAGKIVFTGDKLKLGLPRLPRRSGRSYWGSSGRWYWGWNEKLWARPVGSANRTGVENRWKFSPLDVLNYLQWRWKVFLSVRFKWSRHGF